MKKKTQLLHGISYGSGPVVVLLHGFLASSKYWARVSELVAENNRVIAIDLLGFGNSPKPLFNSYDYDDHIETINQTLTSMGVTQPFILVGHSMGALIALRYANDYKTKVRELILMNMPIMLGSKEVKSEFFASNIIYRLGLSPYTHRFMWFMLRVLFMLRLLPARPQKKLSENKDFVFKHSSRSRLRSFRKVIMNARTEVDLASVQVKTTVLSGVYDKKIYLYNLLNNIQLSPFVMLKNVETGHHIPRFMPELLLQSLKD